MVQFNTKIIQNERYDYIFDKIKKKYGKLKSYTKEEIEFINNINNMENNVNKLSNKNKITGGNVVSYYYNNPLNIINLSIFLLIIILFFNFIIKNPKYSNSFGETGIYLSNMGIYLSTSVCLLNIFIGFTILFFTSDTVNNYKNKSILSYILVLFLSFVILYFYFHFAIKTIYKFKLQGVLIPLGVFGAFIPVYHLYNYTYNYFKKQKSSPNIFLKYVKEIKNLYISTIDLIPELIQTPLPNIPQISSNNPVFKFIRKGIQTLQIDTSGNGGIVISFPALNLPFVNPVAAICCLGVYIGKLAVLAYEKVIKPFGELIIKFWNKIEPIFKKFVDAVITPIVDFFNMLIDEITGLWDTIWWNGIYKVIEDIINFLSNLNIFDDLGLSSSSSDLSAAKAEEAANERNRRATAAAEKKKLQNAQAIDKAAADRAVKRVISQYKSKQKTTTIAGMEAFTNQTTSGLSNLETSVDQNYQPSDTTKYNKTSINNPNAGGNKKRKFTEQFLGGLKNDVPILNSIKKKKHQYIKKYHKRIDNIVKINYPVCHKAKKKALKGFCNVNKNIKKKCEETKKKCKKQEKSNKNFLKYNCDLCMINTCKKDIKKLNIPKNISKKLINNTLEFDEMIKNPKIFYLIGDLYVRRFRNNVINLKRLRKLYKKNKNKDILKSIHKIKLDNEFIFIKIGDFIENDKSNILKNKLKKYRTKYKNPKKLLKKYITGGGLFGSIASGISSIGSSIASAAGSVASWAEDTAGSIADFASSCVSDPQECAENIGEALDNAASAVGDGINAAANAALDGLEAGWEGLKDLANAALAWVKDAINGLLGALQSAVNAAKKPIDDFRTILSKVINFFSVQIPKIGGLFNTIGNLFTKIGRKALEVIKKIGEILAKFGPVLVKMLNNIRLIVVWHIKTVLFNQLKLIKIQVQFLKFYMELAKSVVNSVASQFNNSKDSATSFPPILQKIMSITDIPFEQVFDSIEDLVEKVSKIFDWKTIKTIIDNFKAILSTALDIAKQIPCPPIMAVAGVYNAINDLLGLVNYSLDEFPLWAPIKPLFNEMMSFKNSTCSIDNLSNTFNVIKDATADVADLVAENSHLIVEQDYEQMAKDSKESQKSAVRTAINSTKSQEEEIYNKLKQSDLPLNTIKEYLLKGRRIMKTRIGTTPTKQQLEDFSLAPLIDLNEIRICKDQDNFVCGSDDNDTTWFNYLEDLDTEDLGLSMKNIRTSAT